MDYECVYNKMKEDDLEELLLDREDLLLIISALDNAGDEKSKLLKEFILGIFYEEE